MLSPRICNLSLWLILLGGNQWQPAYGQRALTRRRLETCTGSPSGGLPRSRTGETGWLSKYPRLLNIDVTPKARQIHRIISKIVQDPFVPFVSMSPDGERRG